MAQLALASVAVVGDHIYHRPCTRVTPGSASSGRLPACCTWFPEDMTRKSQHGDDDDDNDDDDDDGNADTASARDEFVAPRPPPTPPETRCGTRYASPTSADTLSPRMTLPNTETSAKAVSREKLTST